MLLYKMWSFHILFHRFILATQTDIDDVQEYLKVIVIKLEKNDEDWKISKS